MEASEEHQNLVEVIVPQDDFAPEWPDPVRDLCARLFHYDPDKIRGRDRLGSLAFDDAPAQVEGIRTIVRDASLETWEQLPPKLSSNGNLQNQLQEVCDTLDQMIELAANSENPGDRASELQGKLTELYGWFRQEVAPHALNARIDKRGLEAAENGAGGASAPALTEAAVRDLEKRYADVQKGLAEFEDVLAAGRDEAGKSASEDLEAVFKERADDYVADAATWFKALCWSVPIAAVIAVGTFELLRPDSGSKDAHDFAGLGLWVFVLGLLAFGIRICAQNYRVNRHLATIARSKQSSCSTFRRLTAAIAEEEVRTAVTVTLAQSIFAVEETGMVDGSGDHVTLIERVVASNIPKVG